MESAFYLDLQLSSIINIIRHRGHPFAARFEKSTAIFNQNFYNQTNFLTRQI